MKETLQLNTDLMKLETKPDDSQQCKDLAIQLETLTKEMNQFTYIVSHDLQAPLRMVTGFLELLERKYGGELDESAKQFIDFAIKGANKMKSLIFDLLEYSRLSSVVHEYTEVDLNAILQETIEKMKPVIEETKAILTNDNLPVLLADRKQMMQLFGHLLENAIKYRSTSIPEISIQVKEKNNHWEIAISDNGIGIDALFKEKIFIIFRRLHNDDSTYGGNGIGLAICKKIVDLHNGTIWLDTAMGKGSTFLFTLPKINI